MHRFAYITTVCTIALCAMAMGEYEVNIALYKNEFLLGEPVRVVTAISLAEGTTRLERGFAWGHGFTYMLEKEGEAMVDVMQGPKHIIPVPPIGIDESYYDPQSISYTSVDETGIERLDLLLPTSPGRYRVRACLMNWRTPLVTSDVASFEVIPVEKRDPIHLILGQDEILELGKTIAYLSLGANHGLARWLQGTGMGSHFRTYDLKNKRAFSVIGGGETIASLKTFNSKFQIPNSIFLSTGGGAMLKYLAGESLPGLRALNC